MLNRRGFVKTDKKFLGIITKPLIKWIKWGIIILAKISERRKLPHLAAEKSPMQFLGAPVAGAPDKEDI